jgi:hypothetical protein
MNLGIVSFRHRTMGAVSARAVLDTGEHIGVTLDITPRRKYGYWLNGKRVLPFGAKSATAKYLPKFAEIVKAIVVYEEKK